MELDRLRGGSQQQAGCALDACEHLHRQQVQGLEEEEEEEVRNKCPLPRPALPC